VAERTGILSGTGAKMKAEVLQDTVRFRGAVQADVPFEEITALARGTLLVLSFRGHVVQLGAGARANQLAAQVRSPPSRADRLGIESGYVVALAGPHDAAFRAEVESRAVIPQGVPREPVDVLVLRATAEEDLRHLPRLSGLAGTLWVASPLPESKVLAAMKQAGHPMVKKVRFGAEMAYQATKA
jgi:hypothetical protein